jgi:hypothetical protein
LKTGAEPTPRTLYIYHTILNNVQYNIYIRNQALYLLVCSLFNGDVSDSDYTVSNYWMTVNNELEKTWK